MQRDLVVTIIGGGNMGTYFACQCAAKGYETIVYSIKSKAISKRLCVVNGEGQEFLSAVVSSVTDNLQEAVAKANIIIVTYPAFMFEDFSKQLEPYINPNVMIGVIPGTGGAEFAFRNCIDKGAILFGLQRVPAVARLVEYGSKVCVEGKRDKLCLASIPNQYSVEIAQFMSSLFDMPCDSLPNYLCITMTPSNPILHTTRLATMFEDYQEGTVYKKNPLFYGEWSDKSSERLLNCDAEHQTMLKKLDRMDLSSVKSLVVHYDNSDTPEKMTRKISGIKSLNSLLSPMKQVGSGWIPDFKSRYFTADFPYGLAIIEEFADILNADVPNIKRTMEWYRKETGDNNKLDLSKYGIRTKEDIYKFYLK